MFWTALITAVALFGTGPQTRPTTATQTAAPAAPAREASNREVTCENRPVTGRRINQRRCRTAAQVAADRAQAQEYTNSVLSGNASRPELVLDGGPR